MPDFDDRFGVRAFEFDDEVCVMNGVVDPWVAIDDAERFDIYYFQVGRDHVQYKSKGPDGSLETHWSEVVVVEDQVNLVTYLDRHQIVTEVPIGFSGVFGQVNAYIDQVFNVAHDGKDYKASLAYDWAIDSGGGQYRIEPYVDGILQWTHTQRAKDFDGTGIFGTDQRYWNAYEWLLPALAEGAHTLRVDVTNFSTSLVVGTYRSVFTVERWSA